MTDRAQKFGLLAGPAIFMLFVLLPEPQNLSATAWLTAGIALWMATWWMTEAVPIPVTSLLPLLLFPLLGISPIKETAEPYANPLIYLFLGGFVMALSMERCGLHRRIAMNVLSRVGTRPSSIIGGFMIAGAALSMWVTNTATTMMMLPIGMSVVALAGENLEKDQKDEFGAALMLGIAYACTIGGLGTLIGTVPNALFAGFMLENYGIEIGFVQWMKIGVPIIVIALPVTYLILTRLVFNFGDSRVEGMSDLIQNELAKMGSPSRDEKVVSLIFGVVVLLWLTRPLMTGAIPGLSDTGIAILGAMLLFVIPSRKQRGAWESRFLMDWKSAVKLPWGILLLFGGGLSLASAIHETGLAAWIGGLISGISVWPVFLILLVTTVLVIFLTELTSNTATTAAFLPVMAAVALGIGQNPFLLTVAATIAASAAFMLPVATPPNAIVYGSGLLSIAQMARTGIWMNVAFICILSVMVYFLVQIVFGVELGVLPAWAS